MNKCEKCGFLHYRTDPCRKTKNPRVETAIVQSVSKAVARRPVTDSPKASKSTAAQKVVLVCPENTTDSKASHRQAMSEAGTQALPVDTNSEESRHAMRLGNSDQASGNNVTAHERSPDAVTGKFDKKAWQREYMREYMRKRRAALKS